MNNERTSKNNHLDEVNALRQRLQELEDSNYRCQQQVEQLTKQLTQEKAARQQAEEFLQLTLTSAETIAWDMDLNSNRVVCSPNALEVWGIQEGTREDFFALLDPRDRQQVIEAAERAIGGKADYCQEYRVIRPDGATRWLNSRGQVYRDDTGRVVRLIGLSVDVTERKQTEEALRQSEERLRIANERFQLAAKAVNCLIYDWDLELDHVERTDGLTKILGYSLVEAEPTSQWWSDRIHPDDLPPIKERALVSLMQDDYFSAEYRILNKSNQYVYVLDQCLVVTRDADGKPTRIVGSTTDISERKRAELQLQESQRFIQQIADALPGTLYVYDMLGQRNVYVNRQIGELLGYTSEQIQALGNRLFSELIHPEDFSAISIQFDLLNRASEGEVIDYEYRMRHANGEWRWLWSRNTVSTRTPNGLAHQVVGTVHDVTDRKQAEAELKQREQEFRTLVENTPDIIVRYDRELNHLYINPSIERALGIAAEHFIGKTGIELGFTDERSQTWYATVEQVFETGQSCSLEYEFPNPEGELRLYQARFVPELIEGEQIATVLGVARDITEYKRAELSLRQNEERLRLAMEAAQMGTWDVDLNTGEAVWSEQHFTMLGYEPVATGKANEEMWSSRIHPDDLERVIQAWQQSRQERTLYEAEYRIIRADNGQIAWLAGLGSFTYDQNGQPLRSMGVLFDITARKHSEAERQRIEDELRESEQRLQLAQQAGRIGTWEWNLLTNEVTWSDGIWTLLALELNSITPNLETFIHFIHPDDREKAFKGVEVALAQGEDYYDEFRVIRQDGTICWLLAKGRVIRTPDGQPKRLLGINVDISNLKQAEAALAQSNQTLQAIIQACPLAIMGLRADGTVRIWNPAAERIFGWSQPEVLGQFLPSIPTDKRDEFLANLAATIKGQGLSGVQTQRQKKGNIQFDVELWTAPVNEAQAGISCVSVVADITARKRTEAALRLSEERLHSFVTANVIGILFGDLEGGIQEANDEFLRIVGYTREDLETGKLRWIDITPPEYLPLDEEAIVEARKRGACNPYEKEYIRKDGSRVPVLVGFGLVLAGREEAVAFILDLSERKQAEESLRQSEERLRLALLVGNSGIWDWDIINNQITWSEQIYQFHGLTPETFGGKVEDFTQLIHPEDRSTVSEAIRQAIQERSSYEIEFRTVQPTTRTVRWLYTTGGVIFDQQGKPVRMLGATIDITERKTIETEREQLLRREQSAREQAETANRVKDEFLAVLSHELRTPLNPILGWTRLLRTHQFDSAARDRALATIERNAKLQAQLIEDLLDVSRILQGKVLLNACPVNLAVVIEAALETVRLSAEAKELQIQTVLDSKVGLVNGDTNRLQQVVWNLLSNAVKFTPSGGRVEVKLTQNETCAQIQVSDTGQGISPDFLPYVFDYFRQADSSTTRQFGGLGLGLAIARHLIELHGGTMKAESAGKGLGSTFTVELPLIGSPLTLELERLPTQETNNLQGICILIVDDEADLRNLIRFILEKHGATVMVAANAAEALKQLTESVPDVLISDIGMPNMDGYALMRQIRTTLGEQQKRIRAIALTAYAGEINQHQALAAGFQIHLAKPIEPEQLVKTVAQVVAHTSNLQ